MTDLAGFFIWPGRRRASPALFAILFAFVASACSGAPGAEIRKLVRPSDGKPPATLRVGTSGDYPPFSAWPETPGAGGDSGPKGFSVDVARAYAADQGLGIEWVRFRWPELSADLEAGLFDLVVSGVTVRPDRSVTGRFSLPLATSAAVLLVPADSPLQKPSDLDRVDLRLAVNAGGHLERVARRLFPEARIDAVGANADVLPRLLRKEVDGVVSDSVEAPLWQRASDRPLRTIGPLTRDHKAAWFPPGDEERIRSFDRWLIAAESSGLLDRLRERAGLARVATARPVAALLSSLDERLSLMPAIARAKRVLGIPIEDRAREDRVLRSAAAAVARASVEAGQAPPDPVVVETLFRTQIEAAKWIQRQTLADSAESPITTPEELASRRRAARHRLDRSLRPALIHLGNRIAMLLVASMGDPSPPPDPDDVARALARHGLPDSRLRALHRALAATLTSGRTAGPDHPRQRAAPGTRTIGSARRAPP